MKKTDVFLLPRCWDVDDASVGEIEALKRGLLTDDCLLLLNDNALQEVRIPPGPRLKILNYVAGMRVAQQQQQQQAMSLAVNHKKRIYR